MINQAAQDRFRVVWAKFEVYIPDMVKIGIHENRIADKIDYLKRFDFLEDDHVAFMEVWFENWLEKGYKPWKKIRSENPESTWNNYKLFDYGEEFTEIRELNKAARAAIEMFYCDKKNFFLKTNVPKRSKNEVRTDGTEDSIS
jgi:hypothetical protein